MRYFIVLSVFILVSLFTFADNDGVVLDNNPVVVFSDDNCPLKGKVQIVNNFADLKVEIVDSFEDVVIEIVSTSWEDDYCGQIELVDNFADIKIEVVKNFADVKIRFRNKQDKDRFMQALEKSKR